MQRAACWLAAACLAAGLLTLAACGQATRDDEDSRRVARSFIEALYAAGDADLAMSLAAPVDAYGYITRKLVDTVIAGEARHGCVTPPESVRVGMPGGDVRGALVSDADAARGITARTAWRVISTYHCTGDTRSTERANTVVLEKVNGKWGVARLTFIPRP
ncbi:MAG: hypothetical protein ACYC6L_08040 [Anaerolineae bacterium]